LVLRKEHSNPLSHKSYITLREIYLKRPSLSKPQIWFSSTDASFAQKDPLQKNGNNPFLPHPSLSQPRRQKSLDMQEHSKLEIRTAIGDHLTK
jgi:hypothetical protein